MAKNVKNLVIVILSLIGLCLVAGFVTVYMIVNPATVLSYITTTIQDKTGYAVTTQGNASLSLYPFLALSINEMNLAKPASAQPSITFKQLTLSSPWQWKWSKTDHWQTTIHAKELLLDKFKASQVTGKLSINNDAVILENLTAQCYQGTMLASAQFDKKSNKGLQWQIDLSKIDMFSTLRDLLGDAPTTITGLATIHFIGHMQQLTVNDLFGSLQFNIASGSIKGIDLNYFIDKGIAVLKQQRNDRTRTDGTQFQQLSGTVYIADRLAKSDDVILLADAFTARISGEMSLIDKTLDTAIQIKPKNTPKLMVPLLVSGPVTKPSVKLDTLLIQTILTKEELDELKNKVEVELKKLPEQTSKILDAIFGE